MATTEQKKRGRPSAWSKEERDFIEPFVAEYNRQSGSRDAFYNGEWGFWGQWFNKFPSDEHRMNEIDIKKVSLFLSICLMLSQFLLETSYILPKPESHQQWCGSECYEHTRCAAF